jgi:GTP-binding protein
MRLNAEFVASAMVPASYPRWGRTEIAFAGRSNVGKSSLLNAITRMRGLARTSKTPGRTRAVNFFTLSDSLALVDLPGYGYAKMSRADAERLGRLINDYLTRREQLVELVLLVDARRALEAEEFSLIRLPETNPGELRRSCRVLVVATKCDKLRSAERARAVQRFRQQGVDPLMCSASTGEGIDELRRRILALAEDRGESLPAHG